MLISTESIELSSRHSLTTAVSIGWLYWAQLPERVAVEAIVFHICSCCYLAHAIVNSLIWSLTTISSVR